MKAKSEAIDPEFRFKPSAMSRVPRHERHLAAPGDTDLKNCKVRVTMYVDADIVEWFKKRASAPDAAAYQTQINSALRRHITRDGKELPASTKLLHDDRFIRAVAKRIISLPPPASSRPRSEASRPRPR
jgi:uncharacterized protein (DUF4415 family)